MHMQWRDLLFVHWPVDAELIDRLLPTSIEPDTFDGSAWVGLIPFAMPKVRALGVPLPGSASMLECNVRTYVTVNGTPGVWFFTLDADGLFAVLGARMGFNLNYRMARMTMHREGDRISYTVKRRDHHDRRHIAQRYPINAIDTDSPAMKCVWTVGDELPRAQPGALEHFLTERYALFTVNRRQRVMMGPIEHGPWTLRAARLAELNDQLVSAAGIDVTNIGRDQMSVFCSDGVDARAWRARPV